MTTARQITVLKKKQCPRTVDIGMTLLSFCPERKAGSISEKEPKLHLKFSEQIINLDIKLNLLIQDKTQVLVI